MGDIHGKKPFSVTHTHATAARAMQGTPSTATARIVITDIAGSSDKGGAIISVKCGTPTVWQFQLGSGTPNGHSHSFGMPIICGVQKNAAVEVDGVALCKANIAGYVIP